MRVSKQPGEKWLVQLRQGGGELDIKEKDDAVFDSDEGLIVYHNDAGKTVTFAPKEGIGWIRAYHPQGGGGFSKMRLQDEVGRAEPSAPMMAQVVEVRELEEPQKRKPATDAYPTPVPCNLCHHSQVMHDHFTGPCKICRCGQYGARANDGA